jgi:hypothetical protein
MNVLLIQPGSTAGAVRIWLRAEGLVTFCLAVFLYWNAGYSWGLFAILFLAPDVSFAGYLAGPREGAAVYNAFHSFVLPLATGVVLLLAGLGVAIPLIWAAHIGFDRMLGYGLKYSTSFGDTHLGRVGGGSARSVVDDA